MNTENKQLPKIQVSELSEIRCSKCKKLKAKAKLTQGSEVEVFCKRCKAFTTITK